MMRTNTENKFVVYSKIRTTTPMNRLRRVSILLGARESSFWKSFTTCRVYSTLKTKLSFHNGKKWNDPRARKNSAKSLFRFFSFSYQINSLFWIYVILTNANNRFQNTDEIEQNKCSEFKKKNPELLRKMTNTVLDKNFVGNWFQY